MKTKTPCVSGWIGRALALALAGWASVYTVSAAALVRGELSREVYTNIFGPLISDLTNSAKFPAAPDVVGTLTQFETPRDWGEMFGERLSGFLIPPVTGEYVFYLASDDQGALYLSTDHQRSNLVQIATESNWSWPRNWTDISAGRTNHENISALIHLEAGRAYFVEALHKEFGGGDCLGVAWQPPGAPVPVNGSEPIPGYFLGIQRPDVSPMVQVVTPSDGTVLAEGANVQLGANVLNTDDTLIRVEFYANETFLGLATGPLVTPAGNYLLTWNDVPAGEFAITARVIDASGLVTISQPTHVTVQQAPPPPTGERELHVVGIYSGKYGNGPSPNHEEGLASVLVNRRGQRVTLCLNAYEAVLWLITPTNGTVIERVVLSGYYTQRVQGLGAEVEVLRYGFGDAAGPYFWTGYDLDSGRFYRTVPTIRAITGLEIGSFHGAYTAPHPVPFVIDSLQDEPRLRSDYPQPTPASELPSLAFDLAFFSGTGPGPGEVFSRSYTLAGPNVGTEVLPGLRVVPDAGGRYFYAALAQNVMRVDSQTRIGELMDLGSGVPELSWSMGMAYDSLRNRELLTTLGGEGFLYAYGPASNRWTLVSSMDNRDVDSIVHHPALDTIYGFEVYRADYYPPKLFRFSATGVCQGAIQLPVLPWDVGVSCYASEMVSVGDYLVLLIGRDVMFPSYPPQRVESRMYLIDPHSNRVWLTYRHVQPNQPPSVVISTPTDGSSFVVGSAIHVVAMANDADGILQSVEFFADGQSLGQLRRSWGPFEWNWTNAAVGTHLLTAKATDNEAGVTESLPVQITVTLPAPILSWPHPANIVYGTALGPAQLNATANMPGTFAYSPPAGTILGAGEHILSVTFTPSDPACLHATATVPLHVNRAPLAIKADDFARLEGTPNPPFTATYSGFVAGDTPTILDTPVALTTTATLNSPPGVYPIIASGASAANYDITLQNGRLTVLASSGILPAPEDQHYPAIASDGENFLVTWLDRRNHSGGSWIECDVYGTRVSPDGTVLDRNGILIASNSVWASPPAVAFDGQNYLVVWQQNGPELGPIRGSRVARGGVLLDGPDGFPIGAAVNRLQSDPKLAFNSSTFLVAWNDWRNQTNGIPDNLICDIYGARVTPGGTVLDPENIPIVRAPLWQTSAAVAAIGDDFLVVWQDMDGIFGAPVSSAGAVSAPFPVSYGMRGSTARPVLASLGNNYLAAWEEGFNLGDNVVWSWVAGTRLTGQGFPLDGQGFGIRTNTGGYNNQLSITTAPDSWWLVWNDVSEYAATRGIWAARVSAAAEVGPTVPINVLPVQQAGPAVACNGSVLLVAWSDKRNGLDAPYPYFQFGDIFATLISLEGAVRDTNGFLISSVGLITPDITWAAPAPITYGTRLSSAQLNATANVPGTFVYSPPAGTLLHVGNAQVLRVVFTPEDTQRYARATNEVSIDVQPAPLTIRADNKVKLAGRPNPPLTATHIGLVGFDLPSSLDRPPTLSTTATTGSPPGSYPITAAGASDPEYTINYVDGTLKVVPALTDPGTIDLSFAPPVLGTGEHIYLNALALQADGRVLIGGDFTVVNGVERRFIARLNPDGTLDPSLRFGIADSAVFHPCALTLQPDGKILLGGYGALLPYTLQPVTRLTADGSLDPEFHNPQVKFGDAVYCIAQQPDGKILIGGEFSEIEGVARHGIARLNADGTLDPGFQDVPVRAGDSDGVYAIALQSDGKILIGGWLATETWPYDVARLHPDGSLDRTFRPQARITEGHVWVLAIQPDGKILVGADGFDGTFPQPDWQLVRLNPTGEMDPQFNPVRYEPLHRPQTLALQPDGRIIVGDSISGVYRLNPDGTRDAGFYSDSGWISELALQPDGQIVAAGCFATYNGVPTWGVARLNGGGRLAPVITSQPQSQTRYVSQVAVFSVVAKGTPPLRYQWQKDGLNLRAQTNATLTIPGLELADAGTYRVRVSNAFGSVLSEAATLTVLPVSDLPGSTDLTFDPNRGGELVGLEGDQGYANHLALQPDGKVLAMGDFIGASGLPRRDLVRLLPDGTADPSFRATISPGRMVDAVAIQANGQVLIAGNFNEVNHRPRANLARLNPDGSLDTAFAPVLGGATHDFVKSIVVQPDGKILIGGNFSSVSNQPRYHVARLNPDGSVDPGFVPMPLPPGDNSLFGCLALQADGKVLVGHESCNASIALRRLNTDGSLDSSFNLGVAPGVWCIGVRQVSLAPEGKLFIYGQFGPWRYVARLNSDGSEDKGFVPPRFLSLVYTILAQPDGKVLVGGAHNETPGVTPNGILRLSQDGSIDSTFQAPEEAVGHPNSVFALALRANGRILMSKGFNPADRNAARTILQLLPNGTIDPGFKYRIHPGAAYVSAALCLPDGRAIIGGHFNRLNDEARVGLAGITSAGTLDRSFVPPNEPLSWVEVLARQPDGRILVGGSFVSTNPPFSRNLVRLNPDGSLDRGFSLPENAVGPTRALAVQPDRKILVGGGLYFGGPPYYLARLNPDGSLDSTFDQGSGIAGEDVSIESIVVLRNGQILIGGMFETYNDIPVHGLIRLNPDGGLDETFTPPPELQWCWRIGLQPDGKIIVLGESLLRLMQDGSLDSTFQAPPEVYGFVVEPTGKIIVTGSFDALGDGAPAPGLIRLNEDGSPDSTFTCRIAEGWVNAMVLQADGRVLIGGTFEEVNGIERATVARLHNQIVPPLHPADTSPADWVLRSAEATAYGSAWRSGEDWAVLPNPIPIDYVTRAAMLSAGGPAYVWDNTLGGPPLWWVNRPQMAAMVAEKGLDPWATRRLPKWYTPGRAFEVSVKLAPQPGTRAYALQERVPAGCRVLTISDGGQLDSAHLLLKWGPFTGSRSKVVQYTVLPGPTNRAVLGFAGVASFDGSSWLVQGDERVRRAPRLALSPRRDQKELVLRLGDEPGGVFTLESSTDLLHWVPLMTVTNVTGTLELPVPFASDPQRYYRVTPP